MTTDNSQTSSQGAQRVEEAPLVKTRAKMNIALFRGSASEFGMDSMFESSRATPGLFGRGRTQPTHLTIYPPSFTPTPPEWCDSSSQSHLTGNDATTQPQTLYVIVFGYPADKHNITVGCFESLGTSTDRDLNTEILNSFRIGYFDPKLPGQSGKVETCCGVGLKWADPAQAESVLGQLAARGAAGSTPFTDVGATPSMSSMDEPPSSHRMDPTGIPAIGTPLKLALSALAFRKTEKPPPTPVQKQQQPVPSGTSAPALGQSPGRSVINQVSGLIFGW